jgi:hypothetical protein
LESKNNKIECVRKLRQSTGLSLFQCVNAGKQADWVFNKALSILLGEPVYIGRLFLGDNAKNVVYLASSKQWINNNGLPITQDILDDASVQECISNNVLRFEADRINLDEINFITFIPSVHTDQTDYHNNPTKCPHCGETIWTISSPPASGAGT